MNTPVIGITTDVANDKFQVSRAYSRLVADAGALPFIVPCELACVDCYLELCDGFVLTGGDDPDMRQWGLAQHPQANAIDPARQQFETALLRALDRQRDVPALGVCLGMQLMAIHAGGELDQYLPDHLDTHGDHWGTTTHCITGELGAGVVHSHHRQAITDPGALRVIAKAHDEVIEAVADATRPFYLGVQWHPERTEDARFGRDLFNRLVDAARQRRAAMC